MNMQFAIEPKSDQINADELQDGQKLIITITDVMIRGGQEQPVAMRLAGMDKVYRPCKSMCRVLVAAWGLDAKEYVGRSLELYTDPTVKFGPLAVGGLRISRMSHIDGPMQMALTATKGVKKAYKVAPLPVASDAGPDKAAEWTTGFIDQLGEGVDVAALETKHAKTIDRLKSQRPELYSKVRIAIDALKPNDDDPFGEGPDDSQRGESHTFDADQIIGFIKTKVSKTDVNSLVESHADTLAGFTEEDRDRVRIAQMDRIEELKA